MVDERLVGVIAQLCFAMIVFSWAMGMAGELHVFGLSAQYKIPQELIYILLAMVGVGGARRSLSKIGMFKNGAKPKTASKPCEHPYLPECPLSIIDRENAKLECTKKSMSEPDK